MQSTDKKAFLGDIKKTYKDGYSLILKKNKDYAGDTDPFKNFRNSNIIGVSPEKAILVRISDKLSRIGNIIDSNARVEEETVEDTLLDMINYCAILKSYLKRNK